MRERKAGFSVGWWIELLGAVSRPLAHGLIFGHVRRRFDAIRQERWLWVHRDIDRREEAVLDITWATITKVSFWWLKARGLIESYKTWWLDHSCHFCGLQTVEGISSDELLSTAGDDNRWWEMIDDDTSWLQVGLGDGFLCGLHMFGTTSLKILHVTIYLVVSVYHVCCVLIFDIFFFNLELRQDSVRTVVTVSAQWVHPWPPCAGNRRDRFSYVQQKTPKKHYSLKPSETV